MQLMNKSPRWLVVGLAFPLVVINAWLLLNVLQYFQPLASIFIAAILLSFILDYPVQVFQKLGIRRIFAALWVFLLTAIFLTAVGILLGPIIWQQLNELANRLPSWINSGTQQLQVFNAWAATWNVPVDLSGVAKQLAERLSGQLQNVTGRIINFALDTIGSVFNVLITAVLTFYMVLNGEKLWSGIFQWFPENLSNTVRKSLRQNFNNYFIGQVTLATLIGLAMTLAFLVLRVPLGLLFGLGIGFLALFPFGAATGFTLVSLLVALQNFWLGVEVLAVALIIDQISANFVAPRVLGGFTGLNPVWILMSLLLGAKIGGVLGLLMAVPLASFIKSMAEIWRNASFTADGLLASTTVVPAVAIASDTSVGD